MFKWFELRKMEEKEGVEGENLEETKAEVRNIRWMLSISLIIFIFTFYSITAYVYYPYAYPIRNFWYYLSIINVLLLILTIMFSSLHLAEFGNSKITYTAAAYTFIASMLSLFVMLLKPIF